MLHSFDDPTDLSADQCRREVARILARGVLRLCETLHNTRETACSEPSDCEPNPPDKGLDVSATTRPHGSDG